LSVGLGWLAALTASALVAALLLRGRQR